MVDVLYTIGYTGYKIENFLSEINSHTISAVIDVRSSPFSKYHSSYNQKALEAFLGRHEIHYRNYANEFGARQKNRAFYSSGGYLDFDVFTRSDEFLSGVEKLKEGMNKGFTFVLMCAEKDPLDCHRTIMVAREFHKLGFIIVHLLPQKKQSQDDIENRLLERYFPDRNQLTLFENEDLNNQDMIDQSYRKRNAEIGYKMEVQQ
jgi:uncharacterized protein (DUF488 family)